MKNPSKAREVNNWFKNFFKINKSNNVKTNNILELKENFFKLLKKGDLQAIKEFVESKDFDVNTEYLFDTPLGIAINLENGEQIVDYFLSKGANPNQAIISAVMKGNLSGVKKLLSVGADVNGVGNESPLTIAANCGQYKIVKHLLEQGADFNIMGWTEGSATVSLIEDVQRKINILSNYQRDINNFDTNSSELKKNFEEWIQDLSQVLTSNYETYGNLSQEKILEQFSNFEKQLYQDLQNYTEIANLLKSYTNTGNTKLEKNIITIHNEHITTSNSEEIKINSKLYNDSALIGLGGPNGVFEIDL